MPIKGAGGTPQGQSRRKGPPFLLPECCCWYSSQLMGLGKPNRAHISSSRRGHSRQVFLPPCRWALWTSCIYTHGKCLATSRLPWQPYPLHRPEAQLVLGSRRRALLDSSFLSSSAQVIVNAVCIAASVLLTVLFPPFSS